MLTLPYKPWETCLSSLVNLHILKATPHLPPCTHTYTHTHSHTTRLQPLKYAVAWLLLSFLISCVIEWELLSGQLHGNDYFVGHLRPSSAWLNVMDGEEMVMSETLPVLPDPSHSIITVAQFDWAQIEHCPSVCPSQNETHWRSAPWPRMLWSIDLLNRGVKQASLCWCCWMYKLCQPFSTCLFFWCWIWVYTVREMCRAEILFTIWSHYMLSNAFDMPFFLDHVSDAHNVASCCAIQVNNLPRRLTLPLFHPTFVMSLLALAFSIMCYFLWSSNRSAELKM